MATVCYSLEGFESHTDRHGFRQKVSDCYGHKGSRMQEPTAAHQQDPDQAACKHPRVSGLEHITMCCAVYSQPQGEHVTKLLSEAMA